MYGVKVPTVVYAHSRTNQLITDLKDNYPIRMRNMAPKAWRSARVSRKVRFEIDQISFLSVLTVMIFTYILFHFIYPLVAKGLLW